jgi:TonB-linked SusC/RagA family outer membrane protein
MRKILLLGLLGLVLTTSHAFAQDRTITGRITSSEDGTPLPGVNVVLKGTTTGTVTDVDGAYTLTVPSSGGVLIFSFIGLITQEQEIGQRTSVDVLMSQDVTQLGEVVVTAIGIAKEKRSLGYAVQSVASNDIVNARESNIVNSLAGKVAGVQINSSGGQAGSSSRITIRGNSSLTGNNQPLFVIDGIPIDNSSTQGNGGTESTLFNGTSSNRATDIDPNNIANVTVLKGAAATALYGARGANGVIMIQTKSGAKRANGTPSISFTTNYGINTPVIRGFQDEYLQGTNGSYQNGLPLGAGGFRSKDPATNPGGAGASQGNASWGPSRYHMDQYTLDSIGQPAIYDPRRDFYRDGKTWENNISISGGKDMFAYLFSYSRLDEEGIVPTNDFKRNSFLVKIDADLSPKLKYSGSVNYVNTFNKRLTEGNGTRNFIYGLNFWPISHDVTKYETETGQYYTYHPTAFNNPFWLAKNNGNYSRVNRFIINQSLTYEIAPGLSIMDRLGVDAYTDIREDDVNVGTRGTPKGRMYTSTIRNSQINNDLLLMYNKDFANDFALNAVLGNNINSRTTKQDVLVGTDLNVPSFFDISNASTVQGYEFDSDIRSYSVFGQLNLEYKGLLFLNLAGRNDWSSTLPAADNSFFYPSVSLGFVFTELPGLSNSSILPYGKLRASWAQAGNAALPYNTTQTFIRSNPGDGTRGNINVPTQGQNAFELSNQQANSTLRNELITEIEFGGDFRFLNDRVGLDMAYYNKVSNDQILGAPVAPSTGFVTKVVNVGEVTNKGFELTLTASPIKRPNGLQWDIQLNYARNRTAVKALTPGVESIFLYGFTSPQIRADVQNGYGVIWADKFERTGDGQLIIGDDGLPILSSELGAIGNVQPDWTGGLRNTITYKGISLSALFDARIGGDVLNFDLFYSTFYGSSSVTADRGSVTVWDGVRQVGDDDQGNPVYVKNDIPVLKDQAYYQGFYSSSTELFVEDGSFVKLRELRLSYSLPSSILSKTPFSAVNLSVIGRNLYINSNFTYWDPEGSLGGNGNGQGFYHGVTPGTRTLTFGLNLTL